MSTITTINGSDTITSSRTVINTNFSNLNTDKIETSVLDVDTTLAANSDLKVATQKAVKSYVDAGGNVNASTTARGIVEEATQAEVMARTATGGTGARLFVNPSTLFPVALTVIPKGMSQGSSPGVAAPTDTAALVGMVSIVAQITVNKISIRTSTNVSSSALDISLYSEDGQTRLFAVTSATNPGVSSVISVTVSSVTLSPGNYWIMVNTDTATLMQVYAFDNSPIPFSTTAGLLGDVTGKPVLSGTYTITSGIPPNTITPTSVVEATLGTVCFRLDN